MRINPFKDSNLNDLQQDITKRLSDHYGDIAERIRAGWKRFLAKGREKITVMFIPHTEKKIINFHVSIFAISFFAGIVTITVIITSLFIINHSSTIKEVSILKKYGSNSKIQIQVYRDEINKLYDIFQKFKPEITYLYSLTPGSNIDSLWARGGVANPEPSPEEADSLSPPTEVLNIQEIEMELKTTKELLVTIKNFLKYRKKIIENTPSIWPSKGYIISRYGQRNSPFTFKPEFHSGIDIESFPGTEILATAPGKVEEIRWDPTLGLTVSVKHKYGFTTVYSHCQRVSVEPEQKVSKGEVIGYVGRTGKTTKYICYYQVKIGTEFVDPIPYLNRIIQ
jgi:murein DD-endopeptidase MepM/ murein hydrolase activator NlpD